MKEFVIVGRPNSGKTMFALGFAGYLGSKTIDVTFHTYDGFMNCRHFSINEAKQELCGIAAHKTRSLQTLVLTVPVGKATATFRLTDSCGLAAQIHHDEKVRRAMAQALGTMRNADFIFHVMDMSLPDAVNGDNIDAEIYKYGKLRCNYTLLANKIDLPMAKEKVRKLAAFFPDVPIIAVSGLYGYGFREVKTCVARNV